MFAALVSCAFACLWSPAGAALALPRVPVSGLGSVPISDLGATTGGGSMPVSAADVTLALKRIVGRATAPEAMARWLIWTQAMDALSPGEARSLLNLGAQSARAPLLAAWSAWSGLRAQPREAARQTARGLGLLDTALVAGPFLDTGAGLVEVVREALEQSPPVAGRPWEGPRRPDAPWRLLKDHGPPGGLGLDFMARQEVAPILLVAVTVFSARSRPAVLRLGLGGDIAVALNGVTLGAAHGLSRPVPDQLRGPVTLRAGANTVLLALRPELSSSAVLYLRFTSPSGRPLVLGGEVPLAAHWTGAAPAPALGAGAGAGLYWHESLAQLRPADGRAMTRRAIYHGAFRRLMGMPDLGADEAPLYEDLLMSGAARGLPLAERLMLLGAVPRAASRWSILQYWRGRSDRSGRASRAGRRGQADPKGLWLAASALLAADAGQLTRARALVSRVAGVAGVALDTVDWLGSAVDRADGRLGRCWRTLLAPGRAQAGLEGMPERSLVEAAGCALALDRPDLARARFEILYRAWPGRMDYGASLAAVQARWGDEVASRQTWEHLARRRPDLAGYPLEAARAAARVGDAEAAMGALDPVVRWAQHSAARQAGAARVFESVGKPRRALAAWERVLALEPANVEARERVETLAGRVEVLPFIWDARAVIADLGKGTGTARATGTASGAVGARADHPPEAALSVLAEERVIRVSTDGSRARYERRLLRVNRVPEAADERTVSVGYDPSHERVRVLSARILRGSLSLPVSTRAVGPAVGGSGGGGDGGLYFDRRRVGVIFDGLIPGDIIEIATVKETTDQVLEGIFDTLEVLQDSAPKGRLRVAVDAPKSMGLRVRLHLPTFNKGTANKGALREGTAAGAAPRPRFEERRTYKPGDPVAEDRVVFEVFATDLPAIVQELGMPGRAEVSATWQVSGFESWQALSDWYQGLLGSQRVVTPAMAAFVAELGASATAKGGMISPTLLAGRLAARVSRDIRYVGLEFGIHGFQPYRSDHVWARRFGDCKDQANLMTTLAEAAGIAARIVLVRTRPQGRLVDPLPSLSLFDHAIVWLAGRDLYVDTTDPSFGVGELPAADQGAQALVLGALTHGVGAQAGARAGAAGGTVSGEQGARFVRTPVDRPGRSGVSGRYSIALGATGRAGVQGTVTFRGTYAARYRRVLSDPNGRAERLERLLNGRYPGFELGTWRVSDVDDTRMPVSLMFAGEAAGVVAPVAHTLQVARPAGGDGHAHRLAAASQRKNPLVIGPPATFDVAFRYVLPPGFVVADLPTSTARGGPFGRFEVTWQREVGAVRVSNLLTLSVDQVSAADYPMFREFMQAFDSAVRAPLVMQPTVSQRAGETPPAPSGGR